MLLFPPTTISPEALAFARALTEQELAYQKDIQRARNYHSGDQFVRLTARLREFLGDDTSLPDSALLRLNVVKIVNNAVTERLLVKGFDTNETGDTKPLVQWATDVWQAARFDVGQDDVHEPTIRDGEAFVIVSWDEVEQIPRFTPHPRYIDPEAGGDGYGCKIFYLNDDPRQEALYATKQWYDVYYVNNVRQQRKRVTFYYPDRVEKFEVIGSELRPFTGDPDGVWRIPWLDSIGQPLGIAVVPFRNAGGMNGWGGIEAAEAIPLQNAINKELIDLLAASDMTAFRILIALGWEPVDADGKPLPVEPGSWLGTTRDKASVTVVDGADLTNILDVIDSLILKTAQVTDTPASRFILTKAIASSETQKQSDAPLVAKVKKRQARLGNGWEDALKLGVKLHNTFSTLPQLSEDIRFTVLWEPAETRDQDQELARAQIKNTLGVPFVQIMLELGYEQEQVDEWDKERQAKEQQQLDLQQQQIQSKAAGSFSAAKSKA